MTTTVEMIRAILTKHSCLTANEIRGFIYRQYNEHITNSAIAGTIRPLVSKGIVSKSANEHGHTVYWLAEV